MDSSLNAMSAEALCEEKLAISMLVRDWFFGITIQRREEKLLEMLAEGFQLAFPEATLTNAAEFSKWYEGVREQFFNQQHVIRHLDIIMESTDRAHIAVWVNWQASQRSSDSPLCTRLDFDAMQLWQVDKEQGYWRIARYQVKELRNNQETDS